MIRKLIFFILIPLFLSCTVTKRVHRPGFHIQWKKLERVQGKNVERKSAESIQSSQKTNHESKGDLAIKESIEEPIAQSLSMEDEGSQLLTNTVNRSVDDILMKPLRVQESILTTVSKNQLSLQKKTSQQLARPLFWRLSPDTLRKMGLFFIILGGMLLFASVLVAFGAFSGDGNGAWINFFLDLIDISDWFWLLFFILIIILVSYLLFLFIVHVLGSPLIGAILGAAFLALGIFFYALGNRREIEP